MKIKTCVIVVAMLGIWTVQTVIAVDSDSAARKVLVLEKEWNEVYKRSDVVIMNDLLADDYIITVEDGSIFSKPGYIAHNGNSSVHVDVSEMSELQVRMHGNTAVVTGAYHEKGKDTGRPYEYHDRFTDVWMNNNGRWQLITSHYSVRSH